jgi:hypothetical protein
MLKPFEIRPRGIRLAKRLQGEWRKKVALYARVSTLNGQNPEMQLGDLKGLWEELMRCVRVPELRKRCFLQTWQQLASAAPEDLRQFLKEKYGIEGSKKKWLRNYLGNDQEEVRCRNLATFFRQLGKPFSLCS